MSALVNTTTRWPQRGREQILAQLKIIGYTVFCLLYIGIASSETKWYQKVW